MIVMKRGMKKLAAVVLAVAVALALLGEGELVDAACADVGVGMDMHFNDAAKILIDGRCFGIGIFGEQGKSSCSCAD